MSRRDEVTPVWGPQGTNTLWSKFNWEAVTQDQSDKPDLVWEQLSTEQSNKAPEDLIWSEANGLSDSLIKRKQPAEAVQPKPADGLRWPNSQLMSARPNLFQHRLFTR